MSTHRGLDYWVRCLSQSEIPALSNVITEINKLCTSDESSAAELAEFILKDASLTSRILKIANSVHYNPSARNSITTVSRAVVLLGFSGIKSILLMTMLIEHVLKNGGKERMLKCLAKALHRAVQAKFLVKHVQGGGDELLEEVFIYGLVYDVAEMAFWGGNHSIVKTMEKKLSDGVSDPETLQKEILGTSFKKISCGLVKRWKLGPEFEEIFFPSKEPSQKVRSILLADDICSASERGWSGKYIDETLPIIAQFIGMNIDDTRVLLKDRADSAFNLASSFGADKVGQFIPSSSNINYQDFDASEEVAGDSALQLEILREMNAMSQNHLDVNALFHMLLEGAHRGMGLERVGIFIVNKSLTTATLKYAVGEDIGSWEKGLQLSVSINDENYFSRSIHQREELWLKPDEDQQSLQLFRQSNLQFLDVENALIASLYAGDRAVALIVSDRGERGKAIDNSQYESFCYFSQQASQALTAVVA